MKKNVCVCVCVYVCVNESLGCRRNQHNSVSQLCGCGSVAKSHPTLRLHGLQYARLPCPSLSSRICSNPCSLSQWCYLTVSSSVAPLSSCPQALPASVPYILCLYLLHCILGDFLSLISELTCWYYCYFQWFYISSSGRQLLPMSILHNFIISMWLLVIF